MHRGEHHPHVTEAVGQDQRGQGGQTRPLGRHEAHHERESDRYESDRDAGHESGQEGQRRHGHGQRNAARDQLAPGGGQQI